MSIAEPHIFWLLRAAALGLQSPLEHVQKKKGSDTEPTHEGKGRRPDIWGGECSTHSAAAV